MPITTSEQNLRSVEPVVFDGSENKKQRLTRIAFLSASVLSVLAGLYCVLRLWDLILNVGGNNISNDYVAFIQVIDRVLTGDYNWTRFIKETVAGTHCVAIPVLFHIFVARFLEWNARSELIIGLGVNLVRALLVTSLLTYSFHKRLRPLVFGLVLALIFSVSQASMHLFGQSCFPVALTVFGFVLGLWGLVKFKGSFAAIAVMLFGGFIATLSMGNMLCCWFAFLVSLIVLGYRRPRDYVIWLGGLLIALVPYALFVLGRMKAGAGGASALGPYYVIDMIGRQFANDIGFNCGRLAMAEYAGILGLVSLVVAASGCALLKRWPVSARASLSMCSYGLASAVMLSVVRQMVAPWYTGFLSMFWLGLLGLFVTMFARKSLFKESACPDETAGGTPDRTRVHLALKLLALVLIGNIVFLYFKSNRSWTDKHTFLFTRAPASESALRHYRTAPTYCEGLLFQWGDGTAGAVQELGTPLERHRLSAFSDHQEWALQGDFLLHDVRVTEHASKPDIKWLQGWSVDRTFKWSHYQHANLYLNSPNCVDWTVTFPADLRSAVLRTEVRLAHKMPERDGATFKIVVKEPGQAQFGSPVFEKTVTVGRPVLIELPLTQWRGQKITLRFTSDGGQDPADDAVVLRYPVISVVRNPMTALPPRAPVQAIPENVDVSPDFPKRFQREERLPAITNSDWVRRSFGLKMPVSGAEKLRDYVKSFPSICLSFERPFPINEFSHLKLRMSAGKKVASRSMKAVLTSDRGVESYFSMPLIPDEGEHDYLYDLKLLELNQTDKLARLELYPVAEKTDALDGVQIKNASFVLAE